MNPHLVHRVMQFAVASGLSLFFVLIFFNNLTDYPSNFAFVEHVLRMDTIFPHSSLRWRSIEAPWIHHGVYLLIMGSEGVIAYLSLKGAFAMALNLKKGAKPFKEGLSWVKLSLAGVFCLWFIGFVAIGSEWFAMWQSKEWNGKQTAMEISILGLLAYLLLARD